MHPVLEPLVGRPTMKTLTMSEFRQQPGDHLIDVRRDRQSLLLTRNGKPFARVVPADDLIVITRDGRIVGERARAQGWAGRPAPGGDRAQAARQPLSGAECCRPAQRLRISPRAARSTSSCVRAWSAPASRRSLRSHTGPYHCAADRQRASRPASPRTPRSA